MPAAAQYLQGAGTAWRVVVKSDAGGGGVTSIGLDGKGDIYLAEIDKHQIAEYSLTGSKVREWGSIGTAPGQMKSPAKLALDRQGNVYVTEADNDRFQKFSPTGAPLDVWGGSSTTGEPGKFNFPIGIALDRDGNIYVADHGNGRIQKFSASGVLLAAFGSAGSASLSPYDVALDAVSNVYVTQPLGADQIAVYTSAGAPVGHIGDSGKGPGQFRDATGVLIDSNGNLFVDDTGNNRIEELSPTGAFIGQWAGPTSRPFNLHSDITMDAKGHLYVTNYNWVLETCVRPSGCS
jgi:sugar lactone lactonase YvrE